MFLQVIENTPSGITHSLRLLCCPYCLFVVLRWPCDGSSDYSLYTGILWCVCCRGLRNLTSTGFCTRSNLPHQDGQRLDALPTKAINNSACSPTTVISFFRLCVWFRTRKWQRKRHKPIADLSDPILILCTNYCDGGFSLRLGVSFFYKYSWQFLVWR